MKRRDFIMGAGAVSGATIATGTLTACSNPSVDLKQGEILHTVIFDLKHPVGSTEANLFLTDGKRILTAVPGVQDFQAYRQCSPKNDYQYGFLMRFSSQAVMDTYTAHPDHVKFVTERWDTEVSRFQESDFVQL